MDDKQFQEILKSHNLKRIPIYYNDTFVGHVTSDLQYQKGSTYMRENRYAFELAFEQIDDIISLIKEFDSKIQVNIIRYDESSTWMYADKGSTYVYHHVYPKTVRKEEKHVWEGTMDEIFARFDRANNKLRYCNGSGFKFEDEKLAEKYYKWLKIIPEGRSFDLYYGDGIVD